LDFGIFVLVHSWRVWLQEMVFKYIET